MSTLKIPNINNMSRILTKEELNICRSCGSSENLMINSTLNGRNYLRCRECNTDRVRQYRQTENGREKINKAVRKSTEKYRYKQNAREVLNYSVKKGNLVRPDHCSKCKSVEQIHGHHEDYTKPLKVIWLCRGCHSDIHRNLV